MRVVPSLLLSALLLSSGAAHAIGAIVHLQGSEGDCEAFFADVRVISDRTPMDQIFGPTSVKEIDVTAVYENAARPEWVTMRLPFECPAEVARDSKNKPRPHKAGDPMRFRIGEGSYLVKRLDLKSQPIPESKEAAIKWLEALRNEAEPAPAEARKRIEAKLNKM